MSRSARILAVALVPLVLAGGYLLAIRKHAPPSAEEEKALAAELALLERDYRASEDDFLRPVREARTEEERARVHLDASKHPAPQFLARYVALSERGRGGEAALGAIGWILDHCFLAGPEGPRAAGEAQYALGEWYVESPGLEDVLARGRSGSIDAQRLATSLRAIIERSPHRGARAAAMLNLAGIAPKVDRRALLESVVRDYADTRHAAKARDELVKLGLLSVGAVAPDFEAEDEQGKRFKLSDYRGKVAVVDFWGFW